jgi:prepilin-type N-terminal cleavage/methylation domain-containing protein
MTRPRSSKPAFTLIEVTIAIIILVIFFAVAGKLFNSVILLGAAGESLSNTSAQTDSAIFQLHSDVWNSKSIAVVDSRSVKLTLSDGSQIAWTLAPDSGLTRSGPAVTTEQWDSTGKSWTFSADAVSLTIAENTRVPQRLLSQILLAQRHQS